MIIPLQKEEQTIKSDDHQIKALQNLAFVRETMENAGAFTTVPGWGMVAIGFSAMVTSFITIFISNPVIWMSIWILEAIIAIAIGLTSISLKNNKLGLTILHGIGLRFMINLCIPILAAVPLSFVLWKHNLTFHMPDVWLLLYGTSIITAGSYSLRLVLFMGCSFFALGCIGMLFPVIPKDALMFFGFGVFHCLFGMLILWQQYEKKDENHECETE